METKRNEENHLVEIVEYEVSNVGVGGIDRNWT